MTLSEFKAWFEGFTECMDGAPDKDQWKRIKARVKEIDGTAITKTVYLDRYVSPYRPYWGQTFFGVSAAADVNSGVVLYNASASSPDLDFDAHAAMLDLGRAEYSAPPRSI